MKINPSCYVAAAVVICVAALFAFPSRAETGSRLRWEYKILSPGYADDEARTYALNALGNEGWELTGVSDSRENSNAFSHTFYFKRAK